MAAAAGSPRRRHRRTGASLLTCLMFGAYAWLCVLPSPCTRAQVSAIFGSCKTRLTSMCVRCADTAAIHLGSEGEAGAVGGERRLLLLDSSFRHGSVKRCG